MRCCPVQPSEAPPAARHQRKSEDGHLRCILRRREAHGVYSNLNNFQKKLFLFTLLKNRIQR